MQAIAERIIAGRSPVKGKLVDGAPGSGRNGKEFKAFLCTG
jgi:hypothetical protein